MLGTAYYLIAALSLIALQPSAALNATTANSVCNLLQDGIFISNGAECSQYYSCNNGLATLNTCPSGYSFSKDSQTCLPSSMVTCGSDASNPCEGVNNGVFVAAPDSCSDFFYCNNGVGTRGSCPMGLNFDAADQSCNYTVNFGCTIPNEGGSDGAVTINLCAFIPGEKYFGSSSSCKAWQQCHNGILVSGICPSPYYFNVLTASCDFEDNVSCRQVTGDPNTSTPPGALAGTPCSSNGQVVSDNVTCAGYYTCTNSVYSYATCPGGLYFNPPSTSCVNRLDAINDCDRCENTLLQFVNVYNDNCQGYAYCVDGRMASEGVCASGYFSEVSGSCVLGGDEPLYPACNPEGLSSNSTDSSTISSTIDSNVTDSSSSNITLATTEIDSSNVTLATTEINSTNNTGTNGTASV